MDLAIESLTNLDWMHSSNQESIQVFVRVRPPIANEIEIGTAVHVDENGQSIHVLSGHHDLTCHYDHIFDEFADQDDVFHKIQHLLDDVLHGYNSCIFAYGQTSSGKTFTMLGPNGGKDLLNSSKQWGLIPKAAEYLFDTLSQDANEGVCAYMAKASMLQVYNEQLIDLLSSSTYVSADDNGLKIREVFTTDGSVCSSPPNSPNKIQQQNSAGSQFGLGSSSGSERQCQEVYVAGLSEFRVQTAEDVLRLIMLGSANRTKRATELNATSSRSHVVLQLSFEIESYESRDTILFHKSKLTLVDLAGSEKMTAMGVDATAKHLRERNAINKSLSALGNVIAALSSPNRIHVPYRDSKLTRLLQYSLGGNTKTVLIACVAPIASHAVESISTLQFADRAKRIMVRVKSNTVVDDKILLAKAQAEIAKLKLLLQQAISNSNRSIITTSTRSESASGSGLEEETSAEAARLQQENRRLKHEISVIRRESKSRKQEGDALSSFLASTTGSYCCHFLVAVVVVFYLFLAIPPSSYVIPPSMYSMQSTLFSNSSPNK